MTNQEFADRIPADFRLPRAVWVLSWVSFFADVSSEMIYPLLPLFMIGVLGASKTQLGTMEGIAVLIVAFMSAYAGIRSDRRTLGSGRVLWIQWGYGLPVLGKAIIACASIWPIALAGRLLDRFGKGLRGAPRDALIADAVSEKDRGRAFGLHRAFDTAGALLGVLLSALLIWIFTGAPDLNQSEETLRIASATPAWLYRVIFGVGAILGVASFALTFLVSESTPSTLGTNEEDSSSPNMQLTLASIDETKFSTQDDMNSIRLQLPASYWRVLLVLLLFSLANSSDVFLLLRASELGYSSWLIVVIYAVYNLFYTVFSYPAGWLSDRIGRWQVVASGWAIYAFVYGAVGLLPVSQAWGMWPLMALYGIYMALTDGVGKALLADHAPLKHRGAAMGVFYGLSGVTTFFASVIAGILWDWVGAWAALLMGALFALLALIAILSLRVLGARV